MFHFQIPLAKTGKLKENVSKREFLVRISQDVQEWTPSEFRERIHQLKRKNLAVKFSKPSDFITFTFDSTLNDFSEFGGSIFPRVIDKESLQTLENLLSGSRLGWLNIITQTLGKQEPGYLVNSLTLQSEQFARRSDKHITYKLFPSFQSLRISSDNFWVNMSVLMGFVPSDSLNQLIENLITNNGPHHQIVILIDLIFSEKLTWLLEVLTRLNNHPNVYLMTSNEFLRGGG